MAITISGQNNNDRILASDGVLDSISGFNVVGVMTATTFNVTTKHTANHIDVGSSIQPVSYTHLTLPTSDIV